MIVYATTTTLQDGIIRTEHGEPDDRYPRYFRSPRPFSSNHVAGYESFGPGTWALTEEKALEQVKRRRAKRIKELQAEIARLEALTFRVKEGKGDA